MFKRLVVLILVLTLPACSTMQSMRATARCQFSELMQCPSLIVYSDSTPRGVLGTTTQNIKLYFDCAKMHEKLVLEAQVCANLPDGSLPKARKERPWFDL